jgi:hypothetical protein
MRIGKHDPGKWAEALNFWWIIDSKWLGEGKRKEKNSGLISLFMKVMIRGTYCNKCVPSLTYMIILNVCLTTSMHGLHTSTQHLNNETLEPLNWIRVCPSRHHEHSRKGSHVLSCVSFKICKYTRFKPHTRPLFSIHAEGRTLLYK